MYIKPFVSAFQRLQHGESNVFYPKTSATMFSYLALSSNFVLLLLFTHSTVFAASDRKPTFNWAKTKYVYAFGDSYTFVQGTEGHANFRSVLTRVISPLPFAAY